MHIKHNDVQFSVPKWSAGRYDFDGFVYLRGHRFSMANKQHEIDDAFLDYVSERGIVSALEAEALRSELKRRRATQKLMTMQGLLVHKGHLTQEHAGQLQDQLLGALAQPTLLPESDAGPTPEVETGKVPPRHPARATDRRPTERRPTGPVQGEKKPTHERTTDALDRERRVTKAVQDSRSTTDKGRIAATGNGAESVDKSRDPEGSDGWDIHSDSEGAGREDSGEIPAGTIIAASEMTIAQMREQIGIGEGVKLVSDKMSSSLAQFQPDATADQKRYVVIREIARGGMGKVLEVEDTELRRSVALKVLRKELLGRTDIVERFLEEAQITGQLEHPNIVPVHEMGVDGAGNLYFTMKFVEGMSLAEVLLRLREGNRDTRREYPLMRLLDIYIKICEGLSFAHNRGVIHRDLKPANIMVGRFGEVQVMDWGVAKVVGRHSYGGEESGVVLTDRLDAGSVHTMMGAIIGTPSYMAPEQARGAVGEIDQRSDIFSLGVILYEMLSLRSPWTGKSYDEVLEQVRELTPLRPNERNPDVDVPSELERLALRCLEKDPEERIQSVKELAENVRNFIEGRAMGSVNYSPVRLAMKWIGRNKREVTGVMLALIAVVAGVLGTLWYLRNVEQQKILGLADDADEGMTRWESLAENGDWDAASSEVDDARELYQRVLAVDEEDEAALAGIEAVEAAEERIRRMRSRAEVERLMEERLEALNSRAKRLIAGANVREHSTKTERALREAEATAAAALVIDRENETARQNRSKAVLELTRYFIETHPVRDVALVWLRQLRDLPEMNEEYEDMQQRWHMRFRG